MSPNLTPNRTSDSIQNLKKVSKPSSNKIKTMTNKSLHRNKSRIKHFNKLAMNCKRKKSKMKRRKTKRDKENIKSIINIRTHLKDSSPLDPLSSLAHPSYSSSTFQVKPSSPPEKASAVDHMVCSGLNIESSSKFPCQDQSGGDKGLHSLLKKRIKVRKISLCAAQKPEIKKVKKVKHTAKDSSKAATKASKSHAETGTSTKTKKTGAPKAKSGMGNTDMPLQVAPKKGIDDIIRKSIREEVEDKKKQQQQQIQAKETQESIRKKINDLNQGIRHRNRAKVKRSVSREEVNVFP